MGKLVKDFYVNEQSPSENKGNNEPTWLNNIDNKSTWYSGSANFFYNIVNDDTVYIQYGKNESGWASGRFFAQYVKIINETENTDGSISADVEFQTLFFKGRKSDFSVAGFDVIYTITVDDIEQYNFSGNTYADFDKPAQDKVIAPVTVQPQEESIQFTLKIKIEYPNGELSTQIINAGFSLFNPNPRTYRPMAIRKSGSWKDLDSNNGVIEIRKSGTWVDKSLENRDTSRQINEGKNRIRINGQWRQLPQMDGGSA